MVPAKKCSTANASILLYLMYKTNRSVALSTGHFLQRTRHRPWRGWSTILEGLGAVHMLDAKFHQCVDGYVAVCLVLTRDVYAIVKISQLMAKKFFYIIRPLERKCIRGRIGCFAGRPEVSIRHRKLRSSIRRSPCSSSSSRSSRDRCQRSSLRMQVSTAHLLKGSKADWSNCLTESLTETISGVHQQDLLSPLL